MMMMTRLEGKSTQIVWSHSKTRGRPCLLSSHRDRNIMYLKLVPNGFGCGPLTSALNSLRELEDPRTRRRQRPSARLQPFATWRVGAPIAILSGVFVLCKFP